MRISYLMIFTALLYACNAPRNNPLDPDGDLYTPPNRAEITITRLNSPENPIAGVTLIEPNLNLWGTSDENGLINWQFDTSPDSLTLVTQSGLYFSKQEQIKTSFPVTTFNLSLNAKPQINHDSLTSIYNNVNGSTEIYFKAKITDNDGQDDIKNIRLFSAGKWSGDLSIESMPDVYSIDSDINAIDPGLTPESLIEIPFGLSIINQNGDSLQSSIYHISRVIPQRIVPRQPASQSVQRDTITFKWDPIHLDFDFSLEIDVYAVITNQFVRIAKISGLAGSSRQYELQDSNTLQLLSSFNNFWQLIIRDNQGNICRSTPVFFTYER